jgi:predicted metal-dependent enzyme (double-stranded beta helix superfamily)
MYYGDRVCHCIRMIIEWGLIGIYSGREDNAFYRRSENGLIVQGAKTLGLKTIPLGQAVIHTVINPLDQITAAITV